MGCSSHSDHRDSTRTLNADVHTEDPRETSGLFHVLVSHTGLVDFRNTVWDTDFAGPMRDLCSTQAQCLKRTMRSSSVPVVVSPALHGVLEIRNHGVGQWFCNDCSRFLCFARGYSAQETDTLHKDDAVSHACINLQADRHDHIGIDKVRCAA